MEEEYTKTGPEPDKNQDTQHRSLAELERIVAKGKATLIEVGEALIEIHDRKLYRQAGYKNFKTYLAERWKISRAHGYRAIAEAKQVKPEMSPNETKSDTDTKAIKPKEKRAKQPPKEPDVEKEFEKFLSLVADWEVDFAPGDYLRLVKRIHEHTNEILVYSNHEYTDDVVTEQPEAEPEQSIEEPELAEVAE